ncbi:MAG: hypothetical protein OXH70_17425 [Acidobacteria bacterium]|nr:hypothetical protein [Acidobacteriota bacterium]
MTTIHGMPSRDGRRHPCSILTIKCCDDFCDDASEWAVRVDGNVVGYLSRDEVCLAHMLGGAFDGFELRAARRDLRRAFD